MRVGLTGGIASGKTTVSHLFSEFGIPIIDADVIAHELVQPGQPALAEIISRFGDGILDCQGQLDRQGLRTLIFKKPACRQALEQILHPRVRQVMLQQAAAARAAYCILSIPLLVENKLQSMVDRVLLVDVETRIQQQRLLARDAGTAQQVEDILAAQASREQRLAVADDVIDNNGDPTGLQARVAALHEQYLALG